MRRFGFGVILALVLILLTALGTLGAGERATGTLIDGTGQTVGTVQMDQTGNGVTLTITAKGLKPGLHGTHVHAVGLCEGPAFTTAGGHFNPATKQHGTKNPQGAHGGDLPNLEAKADGTATYTATTNLLTLSVGPLSLFDNDGAALVIHADPDDEATDPTGNSGTRIACAVLKLTSPGLPTTGGGYAASPILPWTALSAALLIALLGAWTWRRYRLG